MEPVTGNKSSEELDMESKENILYGADNWAQFHFVISKSNLSIPN